MNALCGHGVVLFTRPARLGVSAARCTHHTHTHHTYTNMIYIPGLPQDVCHWHQNDKNKNKNENENKN